MVGRELGTLDELDLQIKSIVIVEDAAHPASSTLLQQVCYAGMGGARYRSGCLDQGRSSLP